MPFWGVMRWGFVDVLASLVQGPSWEMSYCFFVMKLCWMVHDDIEK